jgi:hypothetical protein
MAVAGKRELVASKSGNLVNFEPFCGNDKLVERPESCGESAYALCDSGVTGPPRTMRLWRDCGE